MHITPFLTEPYTDTFYKCETLSTFLFFLPLSCARDLFASFNVKSKRTFTIRWTVSACIWHLPQNIVPLTIFNQTGDQRGTYILHTCTYMLAGQWRTCTLVSRSPVQTKPSFAPSYFFILINERLLSCSSKLLQTNFSVQGEQTLCEAVCKCLSEIYLSEILWTLLWCWARDCGSIFTKHCLEGTDCTGI